MTQWDFQLLSKLCGRTITQWGDLVPMEVEAMVAMMRKEYEAKSAEAERLRQGLHDVVEMINAATNKDKRPRTDAEQEMFRLAQVALGYWGVN